MSTHTLINLLVKNKGLGYFRAEQSGDNATVYVYDAIVSSNDFWGGITPLDFAKALAAFTAPVVHVRINSPGGDVFAARAMMQSMREHPGHLIAHIDGVAASAASLLVMAARESVIAPGALLMIHNAWTIAAGNASDFIDIGILLERVDQTLISDYAAKTGQTPEQIKAWMDAETYFFGQEAVDHGFVGGLAAEAAPQNRIKFDLSAYRHPPEPAAADPAGSKPITDHLKRRLEWVQKCA